MLGGDAAGLHAAQTVSTHAWLLTLAVAIITVVISFDFLGNALRDAADPHGL